MNKGEAKKKGKKLFLQEMIRFPHLTPHINIRRRKTAVPLDMLSVAV